MTKTNPTINSNVPICGIIIYFPVGDETDVMDIMKKIGVALEDIPQLKTELRITTVKDNGLSERGLDNTG